jgi:hypothetical protein
LRQVTLGIDDDTIDVKYMIEITRDVGHGVRQRMMLIRRGWIICAAGAGEFPTRPSR